MDFIDEKDAEEYLKQFSGFELATLLIEISEFYSAPLQLLNDIGQLTEYVQNFIYYKEHGKFKNEDI